MTIEKGRSWGSPGRLPDGAPLAADDGELRRHFVRWRDRGEGPTAPSGGLVVGLTGGTLWRLLGGEGAVGRLFGSDAMQFPLDALEVVVDGRQTWAVASVVARNRRGTLRWLAMNGQFHDEGCWAPRAHPNDGLVDSFLLEARFSEALKIARRARLGSHLPHPAVTGQRAASVSIALRRATPVWIDGTREGRATRIDVRVVPDALSVVV